LHVIAEQEGVGSIRTVCHRDVFHLPFKSGTLDAVVMIGVFEYFPASYPAATVRDVQLRALAELYRVLAPGGVLFIATKNRFGWPYWSGAKDNSGLRFGSLMPRPVANLVSLGVLRRPFRIVTDSYWRYRWLLRKSGFRDLVFFWPTGGYQAPQSWVDLSDRNAIRTGIRAYPAGHLKRAVLSALSAAGAMRFVVPHFGIVAKKSP
jgi:SAM-dependent methyltransferase